jgi:hypothetical protein
MSREGLVDSSAAYLLPLSTSAPSAANTFEKLRKKKRKTKGKGLTKASLFKIKGTVKGKGQKKSVKSVGKGKKKKSVKSVGGGKKRKCSKTKCKRKKPKTVKKKKPKKKSISL